MQFRLQNTQVSRIVVLLQTNPSSYHCAVVSHKRRKHLIFCAYKLESRRTQSKPRPAFCGRFGTWHRMRLALTVSHSTKMRKRLRVVLIRAPALKWSFVALTLVGLFAVDASYLGPSTSYVASAIQWSPYGKPSDSPSRCIGVTVKILTLFCA